MGFGFLLSDKNSSFVVIGDKNACAVTCTGRVTEKGEQDEFPL
jgi:hypothetical protein